MHLTPASADAPTDDLHVDLFGELHNGLELGRELGLPEQTSPKAIISAGWQRWSAGLFSRLDGEFALVLHMRDYTVLYREPSALHNLFFMRQAAAGEPTVAPRLWPLAEMQGRAPRLWRPALHEYLRLLEVASPHTLVDGVFAVEAGQAMIQRAGGPAAALALPDAAAPPRCDSFAQAESQVDAALAQAIHLRLRGAERPATFLSGGIDSALIAALAARERPDLVALTVGFDGPPFDEAPIAAEIARQVGMQHRVLRFGREACLAAFDRLSRQADQPMADPAAMVTLLAFDHCRLNHDVVLDGTGADEAVGAIPPRHLRVAVEHASRLPRGVREAVAASLRRTPRLAGYAQVFDFAHPADALTRWHGFTRTEIQTLCDEPVSLEHAPFFRTFARFPRHAHFERYSALLDVMTCERLNQALQISGATVRFPYWAPELNRGLRQLRTDFRTLPGQPKRILRAVLARYVPAALWDRPKHGFDFPLRDFLASDDYMLVRRHLEPVRWHDYGVLSASVVQQVADRFIAGDVRLTFRVWALVVLGAWLQHRPLLWGQP